MTEPTLFQFAISTIVSVVGVGIALAVFELRVVTRLEQRLNLRIDGVAETLGKRTDRLEQGQAEVRERMAKLEGLLEGLREAITGRRVA